MKNCLPFALLVLLVGIAAGAAGGIWFGFEQGTGVVIDRSMRKDAEGVQLSVEALRALREGRTDEALGLLEQRTEDVVILFDPHEPYPGVSGQTVAEVEAAVADLRRYRADHPRAAPRPAIDAMVDDFLERGYGAR